MRKEVLDKQKDLEKSNSEIVEKIEKLSKEQQKKFDLIQSKLDKIIETLKPEVSSKIEENKDSAILTAPVDSTQGFQKTEEMAPTFGKYFVLKHTFNNVSNFENNKYYSSEEEEHFGIIWKINVKRCDGFFSYFLFYLLLNNTEKNWEIEAELEPKLVSISSSGKKEKRRKKSSDFFQSDPMKSSWRCLKVIECDEFENDFLVDDCFCAEIAMKLKRMTGIYKENLRSFDETKEESSDVVLIVDDEKFFVSKLYLAHSPYFKNLFMGKFSESKKSEIKLSGIDADDFQKYLEVLYGEQAIDEFNVEGILIVANKYDSSLVIEKCENFLQKESKKTLKTKLQLSKRYNLDALRKQCLEEI
ncbi:hypothetical protein GCK72_007614 [Caenorhabditis remanei]|uniref:BTB domain-containing protein n=1 Tax=Caenorhabditis remanei TaxID=31234 RepID=A0A6A5HJI5_CAERE|nr:hypothetical protein GCK72_007614 [Caenorhabditis remanei]KAF1767655.1 hypothetical protein GCK72_007614 [Caenorhabditis remanei]